jgi:hypothetical protein
VVSVLPSRATRFGLHLEPLCDTTVLLCHRALRVRVRQRGSAQADERASYCPRGGFGLAAHRHRTVDAVHVDVPLH